MEDPGKITKRYQILAPLLDEKSLRLLIAAESKVLGHGGIGIVSKSTGISRTTIAAGLKELNDPGSIDTSRIRKAGGGRKKAVEKLPAIETELENLMEPVARGELDSPLMWTDKSLRKLSEELKTKGFDVSHKLVGEILKDNGFSLQIHRKTGEGLRNSDRKAQMEYIYLKIKEFQNVDLPVITFQVLINRLAYSLDEPDEADSETSEFAVETIGKWYTKMGKSVYPEAPKLLIIADYGTCNSLESRLCKKEIQKLSNETGLIVEVCHFPPVTSKWNDIGYRLCSSISQNWRDKPIRSCEVTVSLVASERKQNKQVVNDVLETKPNDTVTITPVLKSENIKIRKKNSMEVWNYILKPKRYKK